MGSGIEDFGFLIGDLDWKLGFGDWGLGLGIRIWDWDRGLGLGIGIEGWDLDWGLGLDIVIRNWELGLGIVNLELGFLYMDVVDLEKLVESPEYIPLG